MTDAPTENAPEPGEGGLRRIVLASPGGGRAEVYLQGAHVARWTDAGEGDVLYLSPRSRFAPGEAIRGGVPVIFPQFADLGPLPKHGFARTAEWTLAEASADRVVLVLADTPATRELWDHAFRAELTVETGAELSITLEIHNTGDTAFEFTCALHGYFRVSDVRSASVDGLGGVRYHDKVAGGEHVQGGRELRFEGETDRVYLGAPDVLRLVDGTAWKTVLIRKFGFPTRWCGTRGPRRRDRWVTSARTRTSTSSAWRRRAWASPCGWSRASAGKAGRWYRWIDSARPLPIPRRGRQTMDSYQIRIFRC